MGERKYVSDDERLMRDWHLAKNGDLTPQMVTVGSNKKVWWLGTCRHEWESTVANRSKGTGCPICAGKKVLPGFNDLESVNPSLAAEWHPTKNGCFTPKNIVANSNKKTWWTCSKGHEWEERVNIRNKNRSMGCPYCSNRRIIAGENDLGTLSPSLAAQWHPTKNGKLSPVEISLHYNKKVWWICEKGHEWQTSPNQRSGGRGCPFCSGNRVSPGETDLATLNPKVASQWHPYKNFPFSPKEFTVSSNRKVWWICEKGHEWEAQINARSKGTSCPICSHHKVLSGYNDLFSCNQRLAAEWHPIRNGDLTPQMVTVGSNKKVWWLGTCGHEWESTISSRASGSGCPYCTGRLPILGETDFATLCPTLAAEWHPTKNGELSASHVTSGSGKKVWWIGACGHEWEAVVSHRSNGTGCPYCAGKKVFVGFNDLATSNHKLASEWHPTKNADLTPYKVVYGSSKKVWWLCEKGHEWKASVCGRQRGFGCPYCAGLRKWTGSLKKGVDSEEFVFD